MNSFFPDLIINRIYRWICIIHYRKLCIEMICKIVQIEINGNDIVLMKNYHNYFKVNFRELESDSTLSNNRVINKLIILTVDNYKSYYSRSNDCLPYYLPKNYRYTSGMSNPNGYKT